MTGRNITAVTASGLGLLGMGGMALTRFFPRRPAPVATPARTGPLAVLRQGPPPGREDAVRAAQRLNRAAGVLAASVLADSAVEHYRGAFANKAMVTPLVTASLSLAVSAHGNADHRALPHRVRDGVYLLAALTGVVGTGFHVYNIAKKPGGFSWQNLFYSAPIGAPAALSLSGAMGFLAERVRGVARQMGGWRNWSQNVLNGPPIPAPPSFTGLALAGLAALGLLEDHPDD